MPLYLILAIISYLMSPKDNASDRKRALLTAAAVGGTAYFATETETGRDFFGFDGDTSVPDTAPATSATPGVQTTVGSGGGAGGFLNALEPYAPYVAGAVVAGTAASAITGSSWFPWVLGIGAIIIIPRLIGSGDSGKAS